MATISNARVINPKVKTIAKHVRKQCDLFVQSPESVIYGWRYHTDLALMCEFASYTLHNALEKGGFKPHTIAGTYEHEGHCWVRWRGWIVDITLTQFNRRNNKVFIGRVDACPKHVQRSVLPVNLNRNCSYLTGSRLQLSTLIWTIMEAR